jgi:hypothetical protein
VISPVLSHTSVAARYATGPKVESYAVQCDELGAEETEFV